MAFTYFCSALFFCSMKYALQSDERVEATPKAIGVCPCCGSEVVAKCGNKKVWHWAHKSKQVCDHWWENETQWHRDWKNCFPEEWQEVVHFAEDGEKHIADVKTPSGLVIEFQHSAIKPEEIKSREKFYKHMIWIVDGSRLITDTQKLTAIVSNSAFELEKQFASKIEKALPKNWITNSVTVYFDIGDTSYLVGLNPDKGFYKFPRKYFTETFIKTSEQYGDEFFTQQPLNLYISSLERNLQEVRTKLNGYIVQKGNKKMLKINHLTRWWSSKELLYLKKLNRAFAMKLAK